jgi:hypothetical protein
MAASILGIVLGPIAQIIGKVIEDKAVAAQATARMQELAASGALQEELIQLQAMTSAQSDINKVEAANPNLFIAGGRPAAIWVCVIALAVNLIIGPVGTWATNLFGHPTPFPVLDQNLLMSLLFPLLGLGAYRTIEKVRGVVNQH